MASHTALAVFASSLVYFAFNADGFTTQRAELHDGGIWITNDAEASYGRINKPIDQQDAVFAADRSGRATPLDIVQDGALVIGQNLSTSQVQAVDPATLKVLPGGQVALAPGGALDLRDGVAAAVDPADGRVWAADLRAGGTVAALDGSSKELIAAGGRAAHAVGWDGTTYVVSAETGSLVSIPKGATGSAVERRSLDREFAGDAQVSAVGSRVVVLDVDGHRLLDPAVGLPEGAVLQEPGADVDGAVAVATPDALLSVDLASGKVSTLAQGNGTPPTRPVRIGSCVFGGWNGSQGIAVTACAGQEPAIAQLGATSDLVFRVNRGQVIVNDRSNGNAWSLLREQAIPIDNWLANRPPRQQTDPKDNQNDETRGNRKPPNAVPDDLGARPGRVTTLHVLDNDSAPKGTILTIRPKILGLDNARARVRVAPDRQSIQFWLPADETRQTTVFEYEVDGEREAPPGRAKVTVTTKQPDQNSAPYRLGRSDRKVWAVPGGGVLTVPVLGDWRDDEGDPPVLADVDAENGFAGATPDGQIRYTAPAEAGQARVRYGVTDGSSRPVLGQIPVAVQRPRDVAVSATANPDVAAGVVGRPITIEPLLNDLPGSDPTEPNAVVRLAGRVTAPGLQITTDVPNGKIVVTARAAQVYSVDYAVQYGIAPVATGRIKVIVGAAADAEAAPVAAPDSASVRGDTATTVDVLANDVDPRGGVLAVQNATSSNPAVQVAIVEGRWLRVSATEALGGTPAVVIYRVTNGAEIAEGQLTVTQLPELENPRPELVDDDAVVRAGDTVAVPVLDNDFSPTGGTLQLVQDPDRPGELTVSPEVGKAYVSGRLIRYVAPPTVKTQTTVRIDYRAADGDGTPEVGRLRIKVNPAPTKTTPNRDPQPGVIDGRVVQGDTTLLKIPGGSDPDGDSVTLIGIGKAPTMGRVLNVGAGALVYQAYPSGRTGTDEFTYRVADRFEGEATALVRVAVVAPGAPQPPVAVDDVITAAPGARVTVDITANDFVAPGERPRLLKLTETNSGDLDGAKLSSPSGPLVMRAGDNPKIPVTLKYGLTNGIDLPSTATVRVRTEEGYNNPPVVFDGYAVPEVGAKTVTFDVLATAYDPDGPRVEITEILDPAGSATEQDGKITAPVTGAPQVIPFRVQDEDGAAATAALFVPPVGGGAPYAAPDKVVTIDPGESHTIDIRDYVVDPDGDSLRLPRTKAVWASPSEGLSASIKDEHRITLEAAQDYGGPASVTFEVADGADVNDPRTHVVILTVPVQVGPKIPVLRCPEQPVSLVQGGSPVELDITALCHVWTADPLDADGLRYEGTVRGEEDLEIGGGKHLLTVRAGPDARPGPATVDVGVVDSEAATSPLLVQVIEAPRPRLPSMRFDWQAGKEFKRDLAKDLITELRDNVKVLAVTPAAGWTISGTTIRYTPAEDTFGAKRFTVRMTDVSDETRNERWATGQLVLDVAGKPAAPGVPVRVGAMEESGKVQLRWSAPDDHGAPVRTYRVFYEAQGASGGSHPCRGNVCTIPKLTNGAHYRFKVSATNVVGEGPESGWSARYTPDAVPNQPRAADPAVTDRGNGKLRLHWQAPADNGATFKEYEVRWDGGTTTTRSTSAVVGAANDRPTIYRVFAVNNQDRVSDYLEISGPETQAAGTPGKVYDVVADPDQDPGDAGRSIVRITWDSADPNGYDGATYDVFRDGAPICTKVPDAEAQRRCQDTLPNDGSTINYTVKAYNDGHKNVGPASDPAPVVAAGRPDQPVITQVTPTDRGIRVAYQVGDSNGAPATTEIRCTISPGGACPGWDARRLTGPQTMQGAPITNGTSYRVTLSYCNGASGNTGATATCTDSAPSAAVVPYGPLGEYSIVGADAQVSGTSVSWRVSVNTNGRPAQLHIKRGNGTTETRTVNTGAGTQVQEFGAVNVGYEASERIQVILSDGDRGLDDDQYTSPTTGPAPQPSASITQSGGNVRLTLHNMGGKRFTLRCWNANAGNYRWATDFRGELQIDIAYNGTVEFACPVAPDPGEFSIEVLNHLWTAPITWR